jgi:hypothetical protein
MKLWTKNVEAEGDRRKRVEVERKQKVIEN